MGGAGACGVAVQESAAVLSSLRVGGECWRGPTEEAGAAQCSLQDSVQADVERWKEAARDLGRLRGVLKRVVSRMRDRLQLSALTAWVVAVSELDFSHLRHCIPGPVDSLCGGNLLHEERHSRL